MKFSLQFIKSFNFWLYFVFVMLMFVFMLFACSRRSTPTRVDCPVPIVIVPVDTMPAKRDYCPHDVVSSTLAHCTPPGAKCNVCECLKCGATWPCE